MIPYLVAGLTVRDIREGDDGEVREGDIREGDIREGDICMGDICEGDIRKRVHLGCWIGKEMERSVISVGPIPKTSIPKPIQTTIRDSLQTPKVEGDAEEGAGSGVGSGAGSGVGVGCGVGCGVGYGVSCGVNLWRLLGYWL